MRIITDMFSFANRELPEWNTISISGYHMREAGSTAVQEVAFTLANAIAYVEAAQRAGLDIDNFAPRLSFFFNAHNNFLEEVAKYRAARRMWARIMKDRFKAKNSRSMMMRFHTQTAGSTLTAQQPENNIVIPTASTRPSAFPRKTPRASRCAPSRSWHMKPAQPTRSIPWPVRIMWKR